MKIKTIIFDLGGVIAMYNHMVAAKQMSKFINVPSKKIYNVLAASGSKSKFAYMYEVGYTSKEYWKEAAKELRIKKIPVKKFDELWRIMFTKNSQTTKLIKKLKSSKKYKITLLSNTNFDHKKYLTKRYSLKPLFHKMFFSCDLKKRKPNKNMFNYILKKLNTKPQEAIFIDDSKPNIIGAKKLKINVIQFKNNKHLIKNLKKLGVEI